MLAVTLDTWLEKRKNASHTLKVAACAIVKWVFFFKGSTEPSALRRFPGISFLLALGKHCNKEA